MIIVHLKLLLIRKWIASWKSMSFVFSGSFLCTLEPEVKTLLLNTMRRRKETKGVREAREAKEAKETPEERNAREDIELEVVGHRDQDKRVAREKMGNIPIHNFRFWAKRFPYFFLHLYLRITQFKPNSFSPSIRLCSFKEFEFFYPGELFFYQKKLRYTG